MLVPKPMFGAARGVVRGLIDRYVPVQAQIVVTRRCNLSCGYCNEYDDFSPPVPLDDLKERLDKLADLGTIVVTLTGGEPMIHPQVHEVVRHIVSRGMVCTSITNGYPLTRTWIERLNDAGLTLLQISIDNVDPNDMSQKSWSRLRSRLELLREHARFSVNVNAVLGSCEPDETRLVVDEVQKMGFYMTIGLLHDENGQLDGGLVDRDALPDFYEEMIAKSKKSFFHQFGEGWERQMLRDGKAPWKCRAGSRYLYICEDGLVSYCSQFRGVPGTPLLEYTRADLEREYHSPKGCAPRCTIGCVRRASSADERRPQNGKRARLIRPPAADPGGSRQHASPGS